MYAFPRAEIRAGLLSFAVAALLVTQASCLLICVLYCYPALSFPSSVFISLSSSGFSKAPALHPSFASFAYKRDCENHHIDNTSPQSYDNCRAAPRVARNFTKAWSPGAQQNCSCCGASYGAPEVPCASPRPHARRRDASPQSTTPRTPSEKRSTSRRLLRDDRRRQHDGVTFGSYR